MKLTISLIATIALSVTMAFAQPNIKIAKLKYNGGGDWYANKTALPNLIQFCNRNLQMDLVRTEDVVEVGSPDIFLYPYVYMTGHGNVVFSNQEAENLRDAKDVKHIWARWVTKADCATCTQRYPTPASCDEYDYCFFTSKIKDGTANMPVTVWYN